MWWLLAAVDAVVWSVMAWGRGGFWTDGPELPRGRTMRACRVAAVVPARNEVEHIAKAVESLMAQQVSGELRVVVVDDGSTDGTGEVLRRIAERDVRLRVVEGQALPSGWTGKMWAVQRGLAAAGDADYVLLTDADIVHGPGHVQALVAMSQDNELAMVSEMVRLRVETATERATMPAYVWFFAMLYPFRWVTDPRRRTAAAAGGTMLLRTEALEQIGGVERIRGELIDDCALAREVKREMGGGVWLGHAADDAWQGAWSGRRYEGPEDVWEMVARTAYVQLRYSPAALAGTVAGMALLYGGPVALTFWGRGRPRWVGVGCWVGMAGLMQPMLRRYRVSRWWGLALPVIAAFYAGATIASAVRFHRGKGGGWKGRVYARSIAAARANGSSVE